MIYEIASPDKINLLVKEKKKSCHNNQRKEKHMLWDHKIIWFFELDPSSLCGNTIALSTTTSPGIVTLLPEEKKKRFSKKLTIASLSHTNNRNRWMKFAILK
jgi:hypothetical protein